MPLLDDSPDLSALLAPGPELEALIDAAAQEGWRSARGRARCAEASSSPGARTASTARPPAGSWPGSGGSGPPIAQADAHQPERSRGRRLDARRQPRNRSIDPGTMGPGRRVRAELAECSGSVPRTPCPCGLSALPAQVGQQPYLQPGWDERAPSQPTYQWPNSLPQSPRGFASSSSRSFVNDTAIPLLPHWVRFDTPSRSRTWGSNRQA